MGFIVKQRLPPWRGPNRSLAELVAARTCGSRGQGQVNAVAQLRAEIVTKPLGGPTHCKRWTVKTVSVVMDYGHAGRNGGLPKLVAAVR